MTVRKVAPIVGVQVKSLGHSTVGKMRHFRKVVREEVVEFADIIGVGRMSSPIPATRRI